MEEKEFRINLENLSHLARGAAFLGTGGGGDPYVGQLLAAHAISEYGAPRVIPASALADDDLVLSVAMIGAPTVLGEKVPAAAGVDCVVQSMEQELGKKARALMPIEIGGVNSCLPIMAAARMGLPLVNADGMGRAFPEIQMVTFHIFGISATPMVVVDEHLDRIVIRACNSRLAEKFARAVTIEMGGSVLGSCYPMSGFEVKSYAVKDTLSIATKIGNAIEQGRNKGDPIQSLLKCLRKTCYYKRAKELLTGKIKDLERSTSKGFSYGRCVIENMSNTDELMEIKFQNENLIATINGEVKAIVPDLICVVDNVSAEPLPCDRLRYGQRVSVIRASAPEILYTPEALAVVGPAAFGLGTHAQASERAGAGAQTEDSLT